MGFLIDEIGPRLMGSLDIFVINMVHGIQSIHMSNDLFKHANIMTKNI
jgi:hypothetical protein